MNNFTKILMGLILLNTSLSVIAAGGVGLGSTRVIYPSQANKVPLLVKNTSSEHFLINSWIEDAKGSKTTDFIITPPLYVSKPKTENSLQIVKVKDNSPKDREQLYYINVKSIPSAKKEELEGANALQLAVLSNIKLFVRPEKLTPIENLEDSVEILKKNDGVYLVNPTPFYINITQPFINGTASKQNYMLEPYSDLKIDVKNLKSFQFKIINDYGGFSKVVKFDISY